MHRVAICHCKNNVFFFQNLRFSSIFHISHLHSLASPRMASFTNKAYHKLVKSHNHATTQLQQKRRKQFKNLDKLYQKKPEEEPADGGNAARQAITQEYLQLESDMTEKHEQELATFEAGKKAAEESAANADADAAASGVAKMSVSGSGDGGSVNSSLGALEAHHLLVAVASGILERVGATSLAGGAAAKVAWIAEARSRDQGRIY